MFYVGRTYQSKPKSKNVLPVLMRTRGSSYHPFGHGRKRFIPGKWKKNQPRSRPGRFTRPPREVEVEVGATQRIAMTSTNYRLSVDELRLALSYMSKDIMVDGSTYNKKSNTSVTTTDNMPNSEERTTTTNKKEALDSGRKAVLAPWTKPSPETVTFETGLKIMNSLTRQKDAFITMDGSRKLSWYMYVALPELISDRDMSYISQLLSQVWADCLCRIPYGPRSYLSRI